MVSTNILSNSYFCFDSYFPDFKSVSLSHSQQSRTEMTRNKNIWHMCFSLSSNLKAHANKSLLLSVR